jgi:hypothetical protein
MVERTYSRSFAVFGKMKTAKVSPAYLDRFIPSFDDESKESSMKMNSFLRSTARCLAELKGRRPATTTTTTTTDLAHSFELLDLSSGKK